MKKISINSEHQYDVLINADWRHEILATMEHRSRVAIVVSEKLKSRLPEFPSVDAEVITFSIPDGEEAKSSSTLHSLWERLGAAGFTRSDLIIAIGGGATTDLAGFAAATWLRGIDWVAIPTTIAGMVDASIGGKTGINSDYGKNLIGAFHSPIQVIVDLSWLDSLSDRDFSAGLAEVVKCGFIEDSRILDLIKGKNLLDIRADTSCVEELITRSVRIKARVVASDFKEGFEREILNYGHTLGHAVEIHSGYSMRHGEAVSIGMVYVAELAKQAGILPSEIADLHSSILASPRFTSDIFFKRLGALV